MRSPSKRSSPRQSPAQYKALQRLTFSAIRRPLSDSGFMQRTWSDGRPTRQVIAGFIKPNDRLSSLERLEIYNRQYWFRLLDCLYDDYPGLRAILGENKFRRLRIAYLDRYPSASFTLRNLGSRLVRFLEEQPQWIAPHTRMCLDMARFEWAQIVAFDGPQLPPLAVDDLLGRTPSSLRLGLQPFLTLLKLDYPLDEFVLALKKNSLRAEASNAMEMETAASRRKRRIRLPRQKTTCLAVHRWDNSIYYKRLDPTAFALLTTLEQGGSVADACAAAIEASDGAERDWPTQIREWFETYSELGWFVKARVQRGSRE